METTSMRESIDSIKKQLGNGEVVTSDRATGKTTALMEFIHEYCVGFCCIVTCCGAAMEVNLARAYQRMYPNDEKPIVISISRLHTASLAGRPRVWMTDEIWPDAATREQPALETMAYLGGVGTPECMTLHSRKGSR